MVRWHRGSTGSDGDDHPGSGAYGRVTNSERYQVVVGAAQRLVDELIASGGVLVTHGTSSEDFPDWEGILPTQRLKAQDGTEVKLMITACPGVVVRVGRGDAEAFPVCGCDACDENPAESARRLEELLEAALA